MTRQLLLVRIKLVGTSYQRRRIFYQTTTLCHTNARHHPSLQDGDSRPAAYKGRNLVKDMPLILQIHILNCNNIFAINRRSSNKPFSSLYATCVISCILSLSHSFPCEPLHNIFISSQTLDCFNNHRRVLRPGIHRTFTQRDHQLRCRNTH